MSVYTIYDDLGDSQRCVKELLDGDFKKVVPTGYEFHPVTQAARLDDGTRIKNTWSYQGIPLDLSHLPTTIRWKGEKHDLKDLQKTHNWFFVSAKLRELIEVLEPKTHQFSPLEIVWDDDSHAAAYYWFNPCNRIDSMDKSRTTHEFNERTGKWQFVEGKKYVANLSQISDHQIWLDPRTTFGSVWVSKKFKQAIDAASINGIGFSQFEAV